MFSLDFDVWIAIGIIAVGITVFILSRMGILPRKSIPAVAGVVFGVLGLTALNRRRRAALDAKIKRLEEEAKAREEHLDRLRAENRIAEREYAEARAALDRELGAAAKEALAVEARTAAEHQRIDGLSAMEAFEEYRQQLGPRT